MKVVLLIPLYIIAALIIFSVLVHWLKLLNLHNDLSQFIAMVVAIIWPYWAGVAATLIIVYLCFKVLMFVAKFAVEQQPKGPMKSPEVSSPQT